MKTIFINDVEFELVPVYTCSTTVNYTIANVYISFPPYGKGEVEGYMLKPLDVKEPLNNPESTDNETYQ